MKQISLLLSFLIINVSGYLIKVPTVPVSPVIPNEDWINRERLILPLFDNVCDQSTDPTVVRLAQEFITDGNGNFKDPTVVTTLKNLVSGKGLLPKGEIFTEYNSEHFEELRIISQVLLGAQDFNTFLKAAAWARQNMNCGLFVDAIYLAMIKRRDTVKLSVPAPYELLPNYFIRKDVIITGSTLLTGTPITPSDNVRDDGNAYIIDANYTSDIIDNDDETKLTYFYEDIGLNSYYFLRKLTKLPWFKENSADSKYGEFLFHEMKQLATRYDLERYANGFGKAQVINWDTTVFPIYDSMLIYSNGNDFGLRKNKIDVTATESIKFMKKIEESITTVVDHMRQSGLTKSQILNNLIEILVTGDKNYETVARQYFEKTTINKSPSVLEHFMTSARDPIFWKLNKKIVDLILTALSGLPTYSRNELYFPGVEIMNVDIKKLQTFFDSFKFDATSALRAANSDSSFQVKISQPRLNHKSFAVKVNISSIVSQKGLMKIYLGPKMLPGQLSIRKDEFMLLDYCEVTLKKGSNIFTRSSEEMNNMAVDFLSLRTLYKNVEDAQFGLDTLPNENIGRLTGFPSRLVIPKGLDEGLPLEVFVFVAPLVINNVAESTVTTMEFNSAIMSPGYPLDLTIETWQLFDLPNAFVKEVVVIHKDLSKPGSYEGGPKRYDSENSFDYSSKKGQYGMQTYESTNQFQKQPFYESRSTTAKNIPVHSLLGKKMKSGSKYKTTDKNQYKDVLNFDDSTNVGIDFNEDVPSIKLNNDKNQIFPPISFVKDEIKIKTPETTKNVINKANIQSTDLKVNDMNPWAKSINNSNSKDIVVDLDNEIGKTVSRSTDIKINNDFNPFTGTINKNYKKDISIGEYDQTNKAVDVNINNSLSPSAKTINKSDPKDISKDYNDGINKSFSRSTDVKIDTNFPNTLINKINKSSSVDISFNKDENVNKSVDVNVKNLNPWTINKSGTNEITVNVKDGIGKSFSRSTDFNIKNDLSPWSKAVNKVSSKDISIDNGDGINKSVSQSTGLVVNGILYPLIKALSKTGSKNITIDDEEGQVKKTIYKDDTKQINGTTVHSSDIKYDDKVNKWSKTIREDDTQDPTKPATRTFDITKDLTKDDSKELNETDGTINVSIKSDKDKSSLVIDKGTFYFNGYDSTKLKEETPTTKRRPSVYDYIVHGYYDDYYDEPKVYE